MHDDGTDTITTTYLVDSYNPTGYAQTIEETIEVSTSSVPQTKTQIQYTIGDDIISQAKSHWNWQDIGGGQYDWVFDTTDATEYLLYDGHGSTRQLSIYDDTPGVEKAVITDVYNYDAYGVAVGFDPSAAPTNMLYAGEYYDNDLSQYNLRARWYDQSTGRFNRMDDFGGNQSDPQSLHKYNYVHNNPVMNIDPSGMFLGGITSLVNTIAIRVMLFGMRHGPTIAAGTFAVTKVTAAMLMACITHMALQELGVLPHNELVAEIGAILGYVLIAELFIITMLPPSWVSPPQAQGRGMNNAYVRDRVRFGIRQHYDKTTDPGRYSHVGCPTQLQQKYPNTTFGFARRGQKMIDVTYIGRDHPSTYPGSTWPSGINQADFKPNTPTGNAFKLPPNTLRIPYDPQTGQIQR